MTASRNTLAARRNTQSDENRVVIAGRPATTPETRYSAAGIPLTRFMLEHTSQQEEAGLQRLVKCRVPVMLSGAEMQHRAARLSLNCRIRVSGFLAQRGSRSGFTGLMLHALTLDIINE